MALTTDDLEGLDDLEEKTTEFIQLVFDWILPLHHQHLLAELYDFRRRIDEARKLLEQEAKNENGDY